MRVLFPLALAALVGCATPVSLITSPGATAFDSPRSVEDVVKFISGAWAKHTSTITIIPYRNGSILSVPHPMGPTDIAVAVWSEGEKTRVTYKLRRLVFVADWVEAPLLALKAEPAR